MGSPYEGTSILQLLFDWEASGREWSNPEKYLEIKSIQNDVYQEGGMNSGLDFCNVNIYSELKDEEILEKLQSRYSTDRVSHEGVRLFALKM